MLLSPGDKLGPYEILSAIGAGGMGEVYKARDPRLDRIVAIKVSKKEFSERFEREARAIAALNHPHICQIYDVGPNFLVMEYIQGEPLQGPLPLDKALEYAAQIVGTLDAAHGKKITHRDLKPANILVTKQGVKLLDFGLAKIEKPVPMDDETLTMGLTVNGQILGTLLYMSPEQVNGKEADARSDIFSFGLVLYEMLTGRRAFAASTPASVIAAILERPAPSVSELAPASLDRILKRCLEKDPDNRWQTARDLKSEIEWIASKAPEAVTPSPAVSPRGFRWANAILPAVLTLALGTLAYVHFREKPPALQVVRFQIKPPPGHHISLGSPALSSDGKMLAYRMDGPDGKGAIYVHNLNSLEARALPDANGSNPMWSPDSRSLIFVRDRKLKTIDLAGGGTRDLVDTQNVWQHSWGVDGTILFKPTATAVLHRIPLSGGTSSPATQLQQGEEAHNSARFLPGETRFIFLARRQNGSASLELGRLGTFDRQTVVENASTSGVVARTPDGRAYILYGKNTTLMAQPFDVAAGKTIGEPVSIVEHIGKVSGQLLYPTMSVASTGTLAYQTAAEIGDRLVWRDRFGKMLSDVAMPLHGTDRALSPDSQRVVLSIGDDLWVLDLSRSTPSRLTFGTNVGTSAVWSPDGKRVAFIGKVNGKPGVYEKAVSGTGEDHLLLPGDIQRVESWSPDGKSMLVSQDDRLFVMALTGDAKAIPVGPPKASQGSISPDGKYVTYESAESGRNEIFVVALPPATGKWQISTGGGSRPFWRGDGKELFFGSPSTAVEIRTSPSFEAGASHRLTLGQGRNSRPAADGQRFLVNVPVETETDAPITVVLNWFAELP